MAPVRLFVEAAVEGVAEPLVGGLPLGIGQRLLRLQRIVDQNDVGAASGHHATIAGGEPVALTGGEELLHGLTVRSQAGAKDPPIPGIHHDGTAISGELVGEILGIADAQDLRRGVVPETPGRKRDRGHQGFQMAGGQVDDQPSDPALPHGGQLAGDDLEVPVHRELGLRVEIVEAARGKGGEILPQHGLVLGTCRVADHRSSLLAVQPCL
jgi:hypothetical protein